MQKTSSKVSVRGWLCGLAAGLVGCAQPGLALRVEPAGSWVYVDGRRAATQTAATAATVQMPLPYYGTTRIRARHPTTAEQWTVDWTEGRQDLVVDEPFSPWLFPLDFVLECVTRPFAASDRYQHRASLALQRRPAVLGGIQPRELAALSARARRARQER